jgi:hypothetical protein
VREPPAASVCSAARLFRVLSSRQPRWPVDFRPPGLERFRLEARGLSAHEADDLFDDFDNYERDKRLALTSPELVAVALLANGQRAFRSAEEVGELPSAVLDPLAAAVHRALAICSPLYGRSTRAAWDAVLRAGAAQTAVTSALGGCVGEAGSERPDLYFGMPLCELTDGQWMAYRAARAHVDSLRPKAAPPVPRKR